MDKIYCPQKVNEFWKNFTSMIFFSWDFINAFIGAFIEAWVI